MLNDEQQQQLIDQISAGFTEQINQLKEELSQSLQNQSAEERTTRQETRQLYASIGLNSRIGDISSDEDDDDQAKNQFYDGKYDPKTSSTKYHRERNIAAKMSTADISQARNEFSKPSEGHTEAGILTQILLSEKKPEPEIRNLKNLK